MYISYSETISFWIGYIPSEQQAHVANGSILDSVGLHLTRFIACALGRGPASLELMVPRRRVNKAGVLLAKKRQWSLGWQFTSSLLLIFLGLGKLPPPTQSAREIWNHSGLLSFPLFSNTTTHQVLSIQTPTYLSNVPSPLPSAMVTVQDSISQSHLNLTSGRVLSSSPNFQEGVHILQHSTQQHTWLCAHKPSPL